LDVEDGARTKWKVAKTYNEMRQFAKRAGKQLKRTFPEPEKRRRDPKVVAGERFKALPTWLETVISEMKKPETSGTVREFFREFFLPDGDTREGWKRRSDRDTKSKSKQFKDDFDLAKKHYAQPADMTSLVEEVMFEAFRIKVLKGGVNEQWTCTPLKKKVDGFRASVTRDGPKAWNTNTQWHEHEAALRLCHLGLSGLADGEEHHELFHRKRKRLHRLVKELFVFPHEFKDETHTELRDDEYDRAQRDSNEYFSPDEGGQIEDFAADVTSIEDFTRGLGDARDSDCGRALIRFYDNYIEKQRAPFLLSATRTPKAFVDYQRLKDHSHSKKEWRCTLPDEIDREVRANCGTDFDTECKKKLREAKIKFCGVCVPKKDARPGTRCGERTRNQICTSDCEKGPISQFTFGEAWNRVIRAFDDDATFDEIVNFDEGTNDDRETAELVLGNDKSINKPSAGLVDELIDDTSNTSPVQTKEDEKFQRVRHVMQHPALNWVLRSHTSSKAGETNDAGPLDFIQWMHILSLPHDEMNKLLTSAIGEGEEFDKFKTTDKSKKSPCGKSECGCGVKRIKVSGSVAIGVSMPRPDSTSSSIGFCNTKALEAHFGIQTSWEWTKAKMASSKPEQCYFLDAKRATAPFDSVSGYWENKWQVSYQDDMTTITIEVGFPISIMDEISKWASNTFFPNAETVEASEDELSFSSAADSALYNMFVSAIYHCAERRKCTDTSASSSDPFLKKYTKLAESALKCYTKCAFSSVASIFEKALKSVMPKIKQKTAKLGVATLDMTSEEVQENREAEDGLTGIRGLASGFVKFLNGEIIEKLSDKNSVSKWSSIYIEFTPRRLPKYEADESKRQGMFEIVIGEREKTDYFSIDGASLGPQGYLQRVEETKAPKLVLRPRCNEDPNSVNNFACVCRRKRADKCEVCHTLLDGTCTKVPTCKIDTQCPKDRKCNVKAPYDSPVCIEDNTSSEVTADTSSSEETPEVTADTSSSEETPTPSAL